MTKEKKYERKRRRLNITVSDQAYSFLKKQVTNASRFIDRLLEEAEKGIGGAYITIAPIGVSPSRGLNTGPADYKSAALPAKPLGHTLYRGFSAVKKVALILLMPSRHLPADHHTATWSPPHTVSAGLGGTGYTLHASRRPPPGTARRARRSGRPAPLNGHRAPLYRRTRPRLARSHTPGHDRTGAATGGSFSCHDCLALPGNNDAATSSAGEPAPRGGGAGLQRS